MSDKVYRVIKDDGTPVNTRAWTNRVHAASSMRWSYSGHKIQEGTVTWTPVVPERKEEKVAEGVDPPLVLDLEHPDLGRPVAPGSD